MKIDKDLQIGILLIMLGVAMFAANWWLRHPPTQTVNVLMSRDGVTFVDSFSIKVDGKTEMVFSTNLSPSVVLFLKFNPSKK